MTLSHFMLSPPLHICSLTRRAPVHLIFANARRFSSALSLEIWARTRKMSRPMDEDEAADAGGVARVKVSVQALSCNQLFDMHWTDAARSPDDAEMSARRSDY